MRLYHNSAFDTSVAVDSHWLATATPSRHDFPPLQNSVSCDIAIIGAGFTGLSAALALVRRHGMDVRVVDSGAPGWGASGRNGGFCCLGSTKLPHDTLARRYGTENAAHFLRTEQAAVEHVRSFLAKNSVDADVCGVGELTLAHRLNRIPALHAEAAAVRDVLGVDSPTFNRADLASIGVAGPEFHAGVHVPIGFGVQPLTYARGLADVAADAGARIHGGSPVQIWRCDGDRHTLTLPHGEIRARRVVVATNGYGSENLPPWHGGRTLPTMSNILVTRPLTNVERETQGWTTHIMARDTRNLLHYFRLLPDGRFLFGGRGGIDAAPHAVQRMRRKLRRAFEAMFPAWRLVETERFWFGFVCLAYKLVPYVGPIGDMPNAWTSLAYHGSGVAMASWCGDALADLIANGQRADERIPAVLRGPMPRFPAPALRKTYLRAAYTGFTIKDEWL